LRRIGLQALDVRALRRRSHINASNVIAPVVGDLRNWWLKRCRAGGSRAAQRAEIYDSLATMLVSGLPLLEAVQTLVESRELDGRALRLGGGTRAMLVEMRERLRGGDSLAQAMREHPAWFDAIDIAIIEAGQHSGTLASVLTSLAQRQERSNELSHKLLGALAYPVLVLLVGLGVVVFLSVKTLPDLTKILIDADIPVPALTARVMWVGQALAAHWLRLAIVLVVAGVFAIVLPRLIERLPIQPPVWMRQLVGRVQPPRVVRQMLVGSLVMHLADLLRSGVPMVESLRVLAPTQRSRRLRRHLIEAAQRIERGDELSAALAERSGTRGGAGWFDPEIQRLLDIGQASGELDVMLTRIGERYQRRAKRLIDRLTVLLEPAVLLLLALLVGVVVMAAILPLLALQEII
jgi:general secretion pathway protein F